MTDLEIRMVVEQTVNIIIKTVGLQHVRYMKQPEAIDKIANKIVQEGLVSKCDPKDVDLIQLKYSYANLRQFAWLAFVNHKCDQFGKISMRDVKQSVESYNAWFNKNIKEI